MPQAYPDLSLTQSLSRLMADRGLRERDLVIGTGLSQSTISSILRGKSKKPRLKNLKAIAKLLEMTTDQLINYSSKSKVYADTTKLENRFVPPYTVPLIEWHEVKSWILGHSAIKAHATWLPNNTCKSSKAFALRLKPSMLSSFFFSTERVGGISTVALLIDPLEPSSTLRDGMILLIFLDDSMEPVLRILSVEGEKQWLHSLEKTIPSVLLNSEHSIVGVITEIRFKPNVS